MSGFRQEKEKEQLKALGEYKRQDQQQIVISTFFPVCAGSGPLGMFTFLSRRKECKIRPFPSFLQRVMRPKSTVQLKCVQ